MGVNNVENETWGMEITRWLQMARKKTIIGKIIGILPIIIT